MQGELSRMRFTSSGVSGEPFSSSARASMSASGGEKTAIRFSSSFVVTLVYYRTPGKQEGRSSIIARRLFQG